ncbi:MAG: hypothetical protein Q8O63_11825 [Hoeflea sp.]|nr:hypothetical protein [Hoeflea sp.]
MEPSEKENQLNTPGWWENFLGSFPGRRFTSITAHNAEDYEKIARQNFESAKKLSDFVGMIVRFAFLNAAINYFSKKAIENDGWLGFIFGCCTISTIGLTVALSIRIFWIVLLFESFDIHKQNQKLAKWMLYLFAIATTGMIFFGIHVLVNDLAKVVLGN